MKRNSKLQAQVAPLQQINFATDETEMFDLSMARTIKKTAKKGGLNFSPWPLLLPLPSPLYNHHHCCQILTLDPAILNMLTWIYVSYAFKSLSAGPPIITWKSIIFTMYFVSKLIFLVKRFWPTLNILQVYQDVKFPRNISLDINRVSSLAFRFQNLF